MEKKYKPATLATLQDDIENLHKEGKNQQRKIDIIIEQLYRKANIKIYTEEN